jgi:hypothetical protein
MTRAMLRGEPGELRMGFRRRGRRKQDGRRVGASAKCNGGREDPVPTQKKTQAEGRMEG